MESYEKYVLECEEKEKLMDTEETVEKPEANTEDNQEPKLDEQTLAERWKERRECLEMLKRELKRVQEGGDPYDWDHLLDDTDDEEKKGTTTDTELKTEIETSNEIRKSNENLTVEEKKEK